MPNGGGPAVPCDAAAQRLRTLHEAARTLRTVSALQDSEAELLQQAIESLTALIGARYGAVAVTDNHGKLARFIHTGINPEDADRIGLLPEGRGLLASGGGKGESLRVDNIARDPRSAGFPAHHPAMTTLLAVPVTYLDSRFGHIYLSERIDGRPFDEDDEMLATIYAEELSQQLAFRQSETERVRAAVVLQDVAQTLSTTSGDNFFQSLVVNLARALGVDYVFIGEPSADRADVIRTLAFCDHGQLSGNIDYHLGADTPCGSVDCKTICHFPDGAGRLYSGDALIRRYSVEAFIGHPLYDSAGHLLGLLVAMNGKAIADEERVHLILQLCANRAAAEIERRRAEENVRESEERFHATFSQAAVGIAHVAPDGRFLRINQKFCDIVEYTQAEMLQRSFQDITHPEDVEKSLTLARRMFAGEIPTYSMEKRYFRKNGCIVWVNVTVSVVRAPDEQPKYLIAVVEDIAARRAADVHMRKLSSAIEQTADAIVITNRDGVIEYVNPAHQAVTGYAPEEAVGKTPDIFKSGRHDRSFYDRLWRTVLDGEVFRERFVNRRKDGTVFYEDKTITPLKNDRGQVTHFVSTGRDITVRMETKEALEKSEQRFRSVVENAPVSIHTIDRNGRIMDMNPAGLRMLGAQDENAVRGREMLEAVSESDRLRVRDILQDTMAGQSRRFEFTTVSGRIFNSSLIPVRSDTGAIQYLLGVTEDITEYRQAEERLNYLAHYDTLTGFPNRILLHDRLLQAMLEAGRRERLVAILFLDLDRFKIINDTLGHERGDALLKQVALRLASCVRSGDTISRLGGDEFTIVLANLDHVDHAARVAQKVIDSFVQPFSIAGRELFVSASIGITLYPFDDNDFDSLLRNADAAMYHAKDLGRNTFQFYTAELNRRTAQRLRLETSLRHALERGELMLHYQPQIDLRSGSIIGAEALLRWQHPEMGMVPPLEFISLAEETGLIIPIGEWVLRTACHQARAWHLAGIRRIQIAVNLSGRQFQHHDLADLVKNVLAETGVDPGFLDLELTESILLQNTEATLAAMETLHRLGVAFSMDDFGTGYSSLAYLKRFPIDTLKIDQSFISGIPTDPNDVAIAQATIALAHSLGIRVIAEGVETAEQLDFLRRHQCDGMQGYYFSKPATADEITGQLTRDQRRPRRRPPSRGKTSARRKR